LNAQPLASSAILGYCLNNFFGGENMGRLHTIYFALAFILFSSGSHAWAAEESTSTELSHLSGSANNFAVGFDIDSFSNNFGGGITLVSPHFLNDRLHVQASGGVAWVQGIKNGSSQTDWAPYGIFKVGIYGGNFIQDLPIRVYGGGGAVILAFNGSVDSTGVTVGGFGVAGVEFFVDKRRAEALFIEVGGMGTGASADKLQGSPIYANGFTASFGYKFYL
jgi:hypothetical protein